MKIIGIVGGIGAGKSTIVQLISQFRPVEVILADEIGHEVLLKGHAAYEKVVQTFGRDLLDENHEIIRRKLAEKVFGNLEALKMLNDITHPCITQEILKRIECYRQKQPHGMIILEAALLVESGLIHLTDYVIAVHAEKNQRLKRVERRDHLPEKAIKERIKAQKKWAELEQIADYIIDNSGSLEETRAQVEAIIEALEKDEEETEHE